MLSCEFCETFKNTFFYSDGCFWMLNILTEYIQIWSLPDTFRSSHQRCFIKKGPLKNFAKYKSQAATLLNKKLWRSCFPVNFAKLLRTSFLRNTEWLLLNILNLSILESELLNSIIILKSWTNFIKFSVLSSHRNLVWLVLPRHSSFCFF